VQQTDSEGEVQDEAARWSWPLANVAQLAVVLNTCDPKEVTMVWVLLLSMAIPNGGGVAIEKFAYYSTEGECIRARTIFGQGEKPPQTPRIPLALCVPVESPQHIITK
jgi:hypothetical protein